MAQSACGTPTSLRKRFRGMNRGKLGVGRPFIVLGPLLCPPLYSPACADFLHICLPDLILPVYSVSAMASASPSPLTPRRKRAVSGADLGVYDMPVNIPIPSTPRSTSDMHETPGLDWGTSPASKDGSPSTPSSISTSSKEPHGHGEAHATPSRTSKKSKRVDQVRLRNESQAALYTAADRRPVKLESSDDEPALLLLYLSGQSPRK